MIALVTIGSTLLPIAAIVIVVAIALANVYRSVRKRFPVKVNCWFCNTNAKVPYEQYNSFFCAHCTQYNGFDETGGYNREIPAHYQSQLNGRPSPNVTDDGKLSILSEATVQGLCYGCNRNQELKVRQLASFVPELEDDYDAEIEEYRKKLEQAYKLCDRCERLLKLKLNDAKKMVLGYKLAGGGAKGMKTFDQCMQTGTAKEDTKMKRHRWFRCYTAIMIGLQLIRLMQICLQLKLSVNMVESILSPWLTRYLYLVLSYLYACQSIIMEEIQNLIGDRLEPLMAFKDNLAASGSSIVVVHFETIQSSYLINTAIVAVCLLLMTLTAGSKIYKYGFILAISMADVILKCAGISGQENVALTFAILSFVSAIDCIGAETMMMKSSDDLSSSFHKIYSQQANEVEQDTEEPRYDATFRKRRSYTRTSDDVAESECPTVFSASTQRAFFDDSIRASSSHYAGSFSNLNISHSQLNRTLGSEMRTNIPSYMPAKIGLTKLSSFSMENFATAGRSRPWNTTETVHRSMNNIRYPVLQEASFDEDIDRLSISGRTRKDFTEFSGNPFAQQHATAPSEAYCHRQRQKPNIAEPLWIATINGTDVPLASRASSHSSGFGSQAGTGRNTPEDGNGNDNPNGSLLFANPAKRLNLPLPSRLSSLLPTDDMLGRDSSNYQHRSLFLDSNIFTATGAGVPPTSAHKNTANGIFPPQQSVTPMHQNVMIPRKC